MFFSLVRFLIGALVFIGIYIVIKAKKGRRRLKTAVTLLIAIAFSCFMSYIPFENQFVTFSSVESAYKYYSNENKNIEVVVSGENCDLIIGKDDAFSYYIFPKNEDGWKIGIHSLCNVEYFSSSDYSADKIQYKSMDEGFIVVYDHGRDLRLEFSDVYNTSFECKKIDRVNVYYAFIPCFDSEYQLYVNGEKVDFGNFDVW